MRLGELTALSFFSSFLHCPASSTLPLARFFLLPSDMEQWLLPCQKDGNRALRICHQALPLKAWGRSTGIGFFSSGSVLHTGLRSNERSLGGRRMRRPYAWTYHPSALLFPYQLGFRESLSEGPGNAGKLRPFEGNADIILSLGDRAQVQKGKADWIWKAEMRDMIGSQDIGKDFISSGRLTVFLFFHGWRAEVIIRYRGGKRKEGLKDKGYFYWIYSAR